MKRLAFALVPLAVLAMTVPALAADADLVAKIKEDIKGRSIFNPAADTPEKKRPVITPDGPVSPFNGQPLKVIFLKANPARPNAVRIAAFFSPSEKKYWTFVWGGPRKLRVITGPYVLRSVTLETVRKAIKKLITDDGSYGFYDGQFKEIESMGKAAIPWLFELFRDESNEMPVRVLALEALGDMKDTSVIPKLRELIYDNSYADFRRSIAFTLANLGDQTFSDKIIDQYRSYIQSNEGNDRAQAAGYSVLAHAYSRLKKHQKAVDCYKKVIRLDPEERSGAYYNLACSLAKMNKIQEAIDAVAKAVDEGYEDWKWMLKDGDMRKLWDKPRFKALIERLKKKTSGR